MKRYFFIKLFVVFVFLIVGYMICKHAEYYFPKTSYGKNELRMVIDNSEVTKSLPQEAIVENGQVFLSFDTVKKYFDQYLYFDKKYNTVIITNSENVMKLPIDNTTIHLNGEEKQIEYPATKSGDVIYLPMKDIQDMMDVKVEYNEKVIISTKNINYTLVKMPSKGKVKLYRKNLSGTTGKYFAEDVLVVFPSGENEEYVKARTPNGSLGYVKSDLISAGTILAQNKVVEPTLSVKKKINLTWEYAENFTPDRSSEGKIAGLNVISPTWFYMKNSSGEVRNTISSSYVTWAKQNGYELWPTVKNDKMGLDNTSALVTDMYAREKFINEIILLAKKYDLEGINIDFEYMYVRDKEDYTQFVREFSAALRRNGLIASVDVIAPDGGENYSFCFDRTALSDAVDYIIFMGYDQFGSMQDGPCASYAWVESSIKKMLERENVSNEKLILGVPFYTKFIILKETKSGDEVVQKVTGRDSLYMSGGKSKLSSLKNYATWDETMKQYYIEYPNGNTIEKLWVEEEKSLEEKAKLVDKYHLIGIASWRRGMETSNTWEIIRNNIEGL